MIIDCHVHAFPNQGQAAGFKDAKTHLMSQQNLVQRFWGRMLTNTLDKKYMPTADEEVGFRAGKNGRWYWVKNGKECWMQRFPTVMTEMEYSPESLIAAMDAIGVDKAVLNAGYMDLNYCRDYFVEIIKKWPDRFIGTVGVDYNIEAPESYRKNEIAKLKDAVANLNMRGVNQAFMEGKNKLIDDKSFDPLWAEISSLGIPHIFIVGFEQKPDYLESLARLEEVLTRFPDLICLIHHLGGNVRPPGDPNFTDTPKELMKILKRPHVYFEAGYVLAFENWASWKENYEYPYPFHHKVCKQVYEEVGAGRLIWGSDMPNTLRTCTYLQDLDLIRLHFDFMSEDEKKMVLGGNAAKIYKI
jgi:predicted TIM-barrel fold metal-dependent hydrolase